MSQYINLSNEPINSLDITNFPINNIAESLDYKLSLIINMSLKLDRYEISKALTFSLNKSISGNKTKLSDIYIDIVNNFDKATENVNLIIEQIDKFNTSKSFNYFVDCENIKYILFYKHIVYVRKLINDLILYINSNINLVYIYAFILNKLYSDSFNIISDYLYILDKIISEDDLNLTNKNILLQLLNPEIINTIKFILENIYNSDPSLIKLLEDYEKNKLNEYKKNNSVDFSDEIININQEHRKLNKNNSFDNLNNYNNKKKTEGIKINNLEFEYDKKKKYLLVNKRDILIDNISSEDFLTKILINNKITIEFWQGFNLFLYKNFNYKFDDYKKKINDFINSNKLDSFYFIELDYLNDLNIPDVGIALNIKNIDENLIGGCPNIINNNILSEYNSYHIYKLKYFKYKNKYLKLKNFI